MTYLCMYAPKACQSTFTTVHASLSTYLSRISRGTRFVLICVGWIWFVWFFRGVWRFWHSRSDWKELSFTVHEAYHFCCWTKWYIFIYESLVDHKYQGNLLQPRLHDTRFSRRPSFIPTRVEYGWSHFSLCTQLAKGAVRRKNKRIDAEIATTC
jgi:hypothetical protein